MGTLEKIIYVRSLIHKDSAGGKYILKPEFDKLVLSDTEKAIIENILEEDKISLNSPITEEDRSKLVKEFEYGEISDANMHPIDEPKYSKIEYDKNDEVRYADFSKLDKFINEQFIPEHIHIKIRLGDKYGEEYFSIQLNHIVKLKLSEIEFKHVMDLLKNQNIIVCGTSEYPDDQFDNYDYFYRLKNIQTPDCISREETLDLFEEMFAAKNPNERIRIRNQIVVGNMRLARWVLFKMSSYYDLSRDFETYAYEGLIQAVDKFNLEKGCYFSTFAVPVIRNFIVGKLREYYRIDPNTFGNFYRAKKIVENNFNRKYVPGDTELLEEILNLLVATNCISESQKDKYMDKCSETVTSLYDEEVEDYSVDEKLETIFDDEIVKNEIFKTLSTLTEREEKILKLHFGLEDGISRKIDEIVEITGFTKSQVRLSLEKGLRKLRHPSRAQHLKHFLDESIGPQTKYPQKYPQSKNIYYESEETTKTR